MVKNKKADIAITILVIGVVALCALALLSFYMSTEKQKSKGINSVFYSRSLYNMAESIRFSGTSLITSYDGIDDVAVNFEAGKFVIEKTYYKKEIWPWKEEEEVLKIKYDFEPLE